MEKRVLVTGASGFLGSWIVREFLREGWRVYGSVRHIGDRGKTDHLRALDRELPGTLQLVGADLLVPGSFDEAASRVAMVVHTASPFTIDPIDNPRRELFEPAVAGTENVLSAAAKSGTVERLVLTSSVVAVHGDAVETQQTEDGFFHEGHWNRTSSLSHQPYSYSKTEAERRAWDVAAEGAWRLVSLNPGFIIGPSFRDGQTRRARNFCFASWTDAIPRVSRLSVLVSLMLEMSPERIIWPAPRRIHRIVASLLQPTRPFSRCLKR